MENFLTLEKFSPADNLDEERKEWQIGILKELGFLTSDRTLSL
jgi:hypothetical protein